MVASSAFAETKCKQVIGHSKKINCYREVKNEMQTKIEVLLSKCLEEGSLVTASDFDNLDSKIESVKEEMVHYIPGGLFAYRPIKMNQMIQVSTLFSRLQDHMYSSTYICN
jgi:hypothetical protein